MIKVKSGKTHDKEYLLRIDNLYRRLKTVDAYALELTKDNSNPKIKDAIFAYIASFGLSALKDIYLANNTTIGFMLAIRSIIEGTAVYTYIAEHNLSAKDEAIFALQAYFIEKEIYEKYPELDQSIFDLKEMKENYRTLRKAVSETYNLTVKELKTVFQSKVPALGNIKSFESLIRQNMSENYLQLYKIGSLYVHPYDYRINDEELFAEYTETVVGILEILFEDVPLDKYGLDYEYNRVIRFNEYGTKVKMLVHEQDAKLNELIIKIHNYGYDFLAATLNICKEILYDHFYDISLGYSEHLTTKWKTVIESLWMLNLCLNDEDFAKDNLLLNYHSFIKGNQNAGVETKEEIFNKAYDHYKRKYPNGIEYVKFKKEFTATTGYTINESGEVLSLRKAVATLIEELSPSLFSGKIPSIIKKDPFGPLIKEDYKNIIKTDISSFLKMKYDESQSMSHATGYLYFTSDGAWHDGTILAYFYDELLHELLTKLLKKLEAIYKEKKIDKTIINYLRNFLKKNVEYISEKKGIYLMPKVQKTH